MHAGSTPVGTANFNMGRLAYQRGQLSVKQPLLALQVRLLPDLPIMESKPIRTLGYHYKAGQRIRRFTRLDCLKKNPGDERKGEYRFLINNRGNDETHYKRTSSKSLPMSF